MLLALNGSLDSFDCISWNLLLKSFWRAGDLVPKATFKNWLVRLVSMFYLLRRSRSKFLLRWMSLYESICLCFNCSLRSRWIRLRSALSACCYLCLRSASYFSMSSSSWSFAASLSSRSISLVCKKSISASSYLLENVSFLTLSFSSMSLRECWILLPCSALNFSCNC